MTIRAFMLSISAGPFSRFEAMSAKRKRVIFISQWIHLDAEQGVIDYAQEANWIFSGLAHHGGDVANVANLAVDGIITLLRNPNTPIVNYVQQSRSPVVDMANNLANIDLPRVIPHEAAISRLAAEHLFDRGFRHLTFLRSARRRQHEQREQAFRTVVTNRGANYHTLDMITYINRNQTRPSFSQRAAWLASELSRLPKPLGVMLNYDVDLPVLTEACEISGLGIPNDIAIVSAGNNIALCELGELPLSSVDLNYRYHAYAAAALLDRLMEGHAPPQSPELIQPSHVVVRHSSDMFATSDTAVKSALSFMRANYATSSIRVADVVHASGASRRHLYTLFQSGLGKGVAEVLTDLRVNAAQSLLMDTDLKIISVAIQAGFSGHEHLIRCFARVVGMTPSEFRKQGRQSSKRSSIDRSSDVRLS